MKHTEVKKIADLGEIFVIYKTNPVQNPQQGEKLHASLNKPTVQLKRGQNESRQFRRLNEHMKG